MSRPLSWLKTSQERNQQVIKDIEAGSEPRFTAETKSIVKGEVEWLPDMFCVGVHLNDDEGEWRVLAEVIGPHPPAPAQVARIRENVAERTPRPVELFVWFRSNTVVTHEKHMSYQEFTKATAEKRLMKLPTVMGKGLKPPEPAQ